MRSTGWRACVVLALCSSVFLGACGSGSQFEADLQAISFQTSAVPGGGSGRLYNTAILFGTEGGAALPDQFSLVSGVLPPGLRLVRDRVDADLDGIPDPDGAFTGHARIIGFPREVGSFTFTVKAISTGDLGGNGGQPDLAAESEFVINVGEGSVNIISPTAAEGTTDPAVPAFPEVIDFVNPADPNAFFSFSWKVAGGSNRNHMNAYVPRELELSIFDGPVAADGDLVDMDLAESGDKFLGNFADGGWFVLQAGDTNVQVGGFQSPRGPVGTLTRHAGGPGLDPDWFQPAGVPRNARRTLGADLPGGDTTLGTDLPVQFTDYFDPGYVSTQPGASPRAKYPFPADQYENAFFVPFTPGVDLTPLRYRVIIEAIDTKGTTTDRTDDVIARKAYIVQVRIPVILVDTVVLPGGRAGIDYNEFVNASGGVPPLKFDLEHVDGDSSDGVATAGHPLTLEDFGLDIDETTGQFFGVPRASSTAGGAIDLTVRVFADVMNPTQSGTDFQATGAAGEFDGQHPITGLRGRHKTFGVTFAPPTSPVLTNATLTPGVDGFAYPGDTLVGAGGVPRLVPYPVGFTGTYPSATARRNYAWSVTYVRDESHGSDAGTPDPARALPSDLTLDGEPTSPTGGQISGRALDRGFHPLTVEQTDAYVGDGTAPADGNAQVTVTSVALSISPDTALYLRGKQVAEGTGGEPTGLLDATTQQGEARMVPMMLAASLYATDTGQPSRRFAGFPDAADILPVMLVNGGSDAHNRKSVPSITGFWPAESNAEAGMSSNTTSAWSHMQQEMVWLQVPDASHRRVFLWAETRSKQWSAGATQGGTSKRYQQYDTSGSRGVLVVDPRTGDHWTVGDFSNSTDAGNADGAQFGAEIVMQRGNSGAVSVQGFFGDEGLGYWKFQRDPPDARWDRELLAVGLGSYIEAQDTSSGTGWNRFPQGRSAVSVAMSADGTWCATAMPGGTDEQKVFLWRTDKERLAQEILDRPYVTGVDGTDAEGNVLPGRGAIFRLGGEDFAEDGGGTFTNPIEGRRLNADSLTFVEGGLVFTQVGDMDRILGIGLGTGALSTRRIDVGQVGVGNGGTRSFSSSVLAARGQYVPDQDYLRLFCGQNAFSAQFAFAGAEPAEGALGPSKLAFLAGETRELRYMADDTAAVIDGKHQRGNRNMSLMFLELAGGSELDLAQATMKDLTGDDDRVYGDLLTPGRMGEELDFVAVSPDGAFVAVVRDRLIGDEDFSSFSAHASTFSTASTSTTFWNASDDLMIVSTGGVDMDTGTAGTQHVLFLGTRTLTSNSQVDPTVPAYASSRHVFNARWKRMNGLVFGEDGRTLLVNYASDDAQPTKHFGDQNSWAINPEVSTSATFAFGTQMIAQIDFRTSTGAAINFKNGGMSGFASNALQGLSGVSQIGPTSPPFNDTQASSPNQFWATFKSANGKFLYYVVDSMDTGARTFLVGFNISAATINGRQPFAPFSPHAAQVGFAQFESNAWGYENRFAAVPAGVTFPGSGRDGDGILCVVGSDGAAGPTSATDLEVYAYDANRGGTLVALTSDVTDGAANAINHLYLSADGNTLVFQRSKTTANSRNSRSALTGESDLCAVTNVHAVLFGGAAPNAIVVSEARSHGSSVALVGEGTPTGPQAVVFSAGTAGGNTTWDDRTLRIALLADHPPADVLDGTRSHYAVLAGSRRVGDDPASSD